jgi:hypothetical protein
MSKYEGWYVKLFGNPAYWLVWQGRRILVKNQAEMVKYGIRPIVTITRDDLEGIPLEGVDDEIHRGEGDPVEA